MTQDNTTDNISLMIDMEMERRRREETLICPHCGHEFDFSDDFPQELVTYWGEDEEQEVACPGCDKDFLAKEQVRRTYESRPKTEDDS